MNETNNPSMSSPLSETIGEELDQLEILAGKIGLNTSAQAFALLHGLDSAYTRMHTLEPNQPTSKIARAQFENITMRLRKEARRFIRDLGGASVLRKSRAGVKPPQEHWWWYLDEWLAAKRQASIRHALKVIGIVAAAFILFAFVYNRFLAPDPKTTESYGHEQAARDFLMKGDFHGALDEVDQGLHISPADPELLTLKGVIQERLGQSDQAAKTYAQAHPVFKNQDEFYVARGTAYVQAGQPEKALGDAEAAIQVNPQSASAYLLLGQANENMKKYQESTEAYNKAYDVAMKNDEPEQAAMARVRLGMMMQSMAVQMPAELQVTPTPQQ